MQATPFLCASLTLAFPPPAAWRHRRGLPGRAALLLISPGGARRAAARAVRARPHRIAAPRDRQVRAPHARLRGAPGAAAWGGDAHQLAGEAKRKGQGVRGALSTTRSNWNAGMHQGMTQLCGSLISSQVAAQLSEHVQCITVLCRHLAQLWALLPDPSSKTTPSPASRPLPTLMLDHHISLPSRLTFAPSSTLTP